MQPNAGPEPRLEAGARHERTLEGVGSRPWFGSVRRRITTLSYAVVIFVDRLQRILATWILRDSLKRLL
jgi:hypothetical protein